MKTKIRTWDVILELMLRDNQSSDPSDIKIDLVKYEARQDPPGSALFISADKTPVKGVRHESEAIL